MRTKLRSAVAALRRRAVRALRSYRQRHLRRELEEQSTEDYWRRREQLRRRRFRLVALRHNLGLRLAGTREQAGILVSAVAPVLQGSALGGLALLGILGAEVELAQWEASWLVPSGADRPPLGTFPTLAVQASASLLGFYLASVWIVLGTSYHDAPSGLRSLVLRNPRTELELRTIGAAIAAGLALVLLQSLGVPYGYVTVLTYVMLVLLGGWAFVQLAFGAFDLFDPVALAGEPLAALQRAFNRIGSKGLAGDEAVLRAAAQRGRSHPPYTGRVDRVEESARIRITRAGGSLGGASSPGSPVVRRAQAPSRTYKRVVPSGADVPSVGRDRPLRNINRAPDLYAIAAEDGARQ